MHSLTNTDAIGVGNQLWAHTPVAHRIARALVNEVDARSLRAFIEARTDSQNAVHSALSAVLQPWIDNPPPWIQLHPMWPRSNPTPTAEVATPATIAARELSRLLALHEIRQWSDRVTHGWPALRTFLIQPGVAEKVRTAAGGQAIPDINAPEPQIHNFLLSITRLLLSGLSLRQIPPEIGLLVNLQTLDLKNNQLTALPPEFGSLKGLQYLYLNNNQLTSLPPEFGGLRGLKVLHLHNNQLTTLPPEFGGLTRLEVLHLHNNQLTALPSEFGGLTRLQHLYLNNNQLTALPPEFRGLRELALLYLNNNQLTALPPEFGSLARLQHLDLRSNLFPEIPTELRRPTSHNLNLLFLPQKTRWQRFLLALSQTNTRLPQPRLI
ncbi:MAG: hypothetical protein RL235_964 [Chlamydiota bacterium]